MPRRFVSGVATTSSTARSTSRTSRHACPDRTSHGHNRRSLSNARATRRVNGPHELIAMPLQLMLLHRCWPSRFSLPPVPPSSPRPQLLLEFPLQCGPQNGSSPIGSFPKRQQTASLCTLTRSLLKFRLVPLRCVHKAHVIQVITHMREDKTLGETRESPCCVSVSSALLHCFVKFPTVLR